MNDGSQQSATGGALESFGGWNAGYNPRPWNERSRAVRRGSRDLSELFILRRRPERIVGQRESVLDRSGGAMCALES